MEEKKQEQVNNMEALGCSTYNKVDAAGLELDGKHKHITEEWIKIKVVASGIIISAQQQSLCKRIHHHRTSIFLKAAKKTMEAMIAERTDQFLTTDRVFRSVYTIVKYTQCRPYTDLETEIDREVLNGLDMGRTVHSENSCANVSQHIASRNKKVNNCKC